MRIHTCLAIGLIVLATTRSFGQPKFSVQPLNQTVNQGYTATFRAVATGTPPLSYQWLFASNAIPGAITNVWTVTNAQPANAGGYFAVVTNASGGVTSRVAKLTVNLPAVLDPKLSANIRLGDDPAELPAKWRAQKEPHIARGYSEPNLLVATFMEGSIPDSAAASCGYSISRDAGFTWTRALFPGLTTLNGGTYPLIGDVVAAVDGDGRLIVSAIQTSTTFDARALSIMTAEPGTDVFSAPSPLFASSTGLVVDKEWIAVNTFVNSAPAHRLAATFTLEGGSLTPTDASQTVFTYTDDGGATWSPRKPIGPTDTTGSQVLFLPDGSLAVVYWHFLNGYEANGTSRIEMALSRDCGENFDPPTVVAAVSELYLDPVALNGSFFPSACADRQAGILYVAYESITNSIPLILFTKSIDKGKTWSKPVRVNDTPGRKGVFGRAIAASPDGQHVTVSFYDKRNDTGQGNLADVYLAESFDGGVKWEKNLRLSEFSSDLLKAPVLLGANSIGEYFGNVPALNFDTPGVAVWIDTRSGDPDPYVVRISRTQGTTFDTWRKLRFSTNDLANPAISGENADPDGDGIPNRAEYFLGLEPHRADRSPLAIEKTGSGADGGVTLSFELLAVTAEVDFLRFEVSADLVNWAPATPKRSETTPGREPFMKRARVFFRTGAEQQQFFRLGFAGALP